MIIETERLILRMFENSDYDDLFEYLVQLENDEFEGYPGITYENGKEHLSYRVQSDEFYAIELKENCKVIGNIYCGKRDFESREVGFIINKNYQRKGYAREAITEVLKEAFHSGVHRVYAECNPGNECSWKLLENLNFEREAFLKQNVYFKKDEKGKPVWQDTYVYGLLADENF